MENHLGPELARILDLDVRRMARHDHGGEDTQLLGVIGNGLGMVAGRHGNDPRFALLRGQSQKLDQGTPVLEGSRELSILKLEPHIGSRDCGKRLGSSAGGLHHPAGDGLGSLINLL